jgi:hypothetical protein
MVEKLIPDSQTLKSLHGTKLIKTKLTYKQRLVAVLFRK